VAMQFRGSETYFMSYKPFGNVGDDGPTNPVSTTLALCDTI
jgi:hypothetical protein